MLKIIADQNLYRLKEFLPDDCTVTYYDPEEGIPSLNHFQAWLVRTVTKINFDSVPHFPAELKFIGTGSSGSDHVDKTYLEESGIMFEDAKGCNARAVAEYVMTSLLLWQKSTGNILSELTFGIIGSGAVGSRVADLLSIFGLKWRAYDPPKEQRDSDFSSCTLDEVLSCDVLTFHVPMETTGTYATYHWLDDEKLSDRKYKLIINAARGGVVKERALKSAINQGSVESIIIDVWENEPDFDEQLAEMSFISTPHIAGYSEQAKLNASKMIVQKMCDFFGLKSPVSDHLYHDKFEDLAYIEYSKSQILTRLHPIKEYDAALRDLIGRTDKPRLFSKLRVDRPYRFEYQYLKLENRFINQFPDLKFLGIKNPD